MKKSILKLAAAVALTIGVISCGNNHQLHDKLAADHKILEQEDSLMETEHTNMNNDHDKWMKTEIDEVDTTRQAQHKLIEEQHLTLIVKHDLIVKLHKELTVKHNSLEALHTEGKADDKKN